MSEKGIYLNDSIHGLIALTEYEKRIISTVGFNRLHDVYQNSTLYLTFPSNRTKRFEHSVGTMKLCSDMFYYSVSNASDEDLKEFFENIKEECKDIEKKISADVDFRELKLAGRSGEWERLSEIVFDKVQLSLIPRNVPDAYEIIYLLTIQSVRAAALLHDIGHPPFSHVVENSLKAICYEYLNQDTYEEESSAYKFIKIMSRMNGEKPLHEQMGDDISKSILLEIIPTGSAKVENLFEVFVMYIVEKIFHEEGYFKHLHKIIDSSLDGDRLDYVTRDPINSGMSTGRVDYHRIIGDMKLLIKAEEPDNVRKPFFCISLKAINAVEDFLKRRYAVYKNMIYHHRVIKTDCLLEYSVKELIRIYLNNTSKFFSNPNEKSDVYFDIQGLWIPMKSGTTYEKSIALSRWDDSWLMTVLKHIFYTEYYNEGNFLLKKEYEIEKYLLSRRLAELLLHKKAYYSLIKRSEDFKIIDDEIKDVFKQCKLRILGKIEKTKSKAETSIVKIPIEGILGTVNDLLENKIFDNSLSISYISKHNQAIPFIDLESLIINSVHCVVTTPFLKERIHDDITVFKYLKTGLGMPIYFYRNDGNSICTLNDISGIKESLETEATYFPFFYVYLLMDSDLPQSERINILKDIGNKIGEQFIGKLINYLGNKFEKKE